MTGRRGGRGRWAGGSGSAAAVLLALSCALLLSSCPSVDLAPWGPESSGDREGAAAGPAAGFGGLKVSGAEFTDNASATVSDDRGRGLSDLVEGMTVTVLGEIGATFRSGTAREVRIEREIRGPVDDNGVRLDNSALLVLGQTVLVTPETVIVDPGLGGIGLTDLKELQDGGYRPALEIHGAADDNGVVHASYVELVQDNVGGGVDAELRGTVREFDPAACTFRIGEQRADCTGLPADGRIDWPGTGFDNGLVVDVWGYLDNVGGGGTLRVDRAGDRIRAISVDLGDSTDRVALEGYVLSGSPSSFAMSVPGGAVTVNSGVAAAGDAFGPGRKVRVRGTVSGSAGTVVNATSVSVVPAASLLLQGPPGDLVAGEDTFTLLGKTVEAGGYTVFRDATGAVREGFGLGSLAPYDNVRVTGWLDNSTNPPRVAASRIDRVVGTAGRVSLQGPVSGAVSSGDTSLSIVGILVNTDLTNTGYHDRGGVEFADRAAFFARLAELGSGTIVRVRNGVFTPASSRIDPPDGGVEMEIEIVTVNR